MKENNDKPITTGLLKDTAYETVAKNINLNSKEEIERYIEEEIMNGRTFTALAKKLGISMYQFNHIIRQPDYQTRIRHALTTSANVYADKAISVLEQAPSDRVEIARARELSLCYRWLASKRAPLVYGERVDVVSDGKAVVMLNLGSGINPNEEDKVIDITPEEHAHTLRNQIHCE